MPGLIVVRVRAHRNARRFPPHVVFLREASNEMGSASLYRVSPITWVFVAVAVCCVAGCGGGDLGRVSGTVTLDGQPLADALVSFYPEDGRPSMGTTDADGNYDLSFTPTEAGAMIGNHIVRITVAQVEGEGEEGGRLPKETIPAKYNSKSELKAEVKPGKNRNVNFDLSS